jgi:hypothetical protein
MVRLMGKHPIRHSRVKQHITHLVFDPLFHLLATLRPTVKFPANTLASRAAWSTSRAMVRWAILQQTRTPTHHMRKATHNMLSNVSCPRHRAERRLTFKAAPQANHSYQ